MWNPLHLQTSWSSFTAIATAPADKHADFPLKRTHTTFLSTVLYNLLWCVLYIYKQTISLYTHSLTVSPPLLLRYKKFREAKDLSTKTDAEKRAIFGASMPALSTSSKSASTTNSARSSEPDCSSSSSSDEEVVKKSKKAKKDKKEKKEKKSKKTK